MKKLMELLNKLIAERFYGSIEIRFEAGKIVFVKQTQTIKVE
jgi:hypothetical protein